MEFSNGLHYLDVGLSIALIAGMCWWTYALTSRSYAQHKLERIVKKEGRRPGSLVGSLPHRP